MISKTAKNAVAMGAAIGAFALLASSAWAAPSVGVEFIEKPPDTGLVIVYATSSSNLQQGFVGGGQPGILDNQGGPPTIGNGAGPPDHVFINITDIHNPEAFTLDFAFAPLGNGDLIIYTGTFGTPLVFLTGVTWDGPAAGSTSFIPFGNAPLMTSAAVPGDFATNYVNAGLINWSNSFSNVTLEFTGFGGVGGAGSNFTIDAISNPEPGTLALFGLGVGGLVARRRRRAATARVS